MFQFRKSDDYALKKGFLNILEETLKEIDLELTPDIAKTCIKIQQGPQSKKQIVVCKQNLRQGFTGFLDEELSLKALRILFCRYHPFFFTSFKESDELCLYEVNSVQEYFLKHEQNLLNNPKWEFSRKPRPVPFVSTEVELFCRLFEYELAQEGFRLNPQGIRHMLCSVRVPEGIVFLLTKDAIRQWHQLPDPDVDKVFKSFSDAFFINTTGDAFGYDPLKERLEVRLKKSDFENIRKQLKHLQIPTEFENPCENGEKFKISGDFVTPTTGFYKPS